MYEYSAINTLIICNLRIWGISGVVFYKGEKLNEYYISFYNENCSNLDEDSRADKIIKHAYWINILKEIQNINEEYIDYGFSNENIS